MRYLLAAAAALIAVPANAALLTFEEGTYQLVLDGPFADLYTIGDYSVGTDGGIVGGKIFGTRIEISKNNAPFRTAIFGLEVQGTGELNLFAQLLFEPSPTLFATLQLDGSPQQFDIANSLRAPAFDLRSASPFAIDSLEIGAIPEPASWAMMIIGFGAIGGTLRSRRTARPALRYSA